MFFQKNKVFIFSGFWFGLMKFVFIKWAPRGESGREDIHKTGFWSRNSQNIFTYGGLNNRKYYISTYGCEALRYKSSFIYTEQFVGMIFIALSYFVF